MKRVGEPYLPDEISGRTAAASPQDAKSDTCPVFPTGQTKVVWRWYAWGSPKRGEPNRWRATCWHDEDLQKAVKCRESGLYHSEFGHGVPQTLVAEITTLSPTVAIEMREGVSWINGVPALFHDRGLGYGSRIKYKGFTALLTKFPDSLHALVTIFDTSKPDLPTEVLHLDTILTSVEADLASADSLQP